MRNRKRGTIYEARSYSPVAVVSSVSLADLDDRADKPGKRC